MERNGAYQDKQWCLSEVDIFCDLSAQEMAAIAEAAPKKTSAAGELLYTPGSSDERLFILKSGRVRIFRVAADGRALTTAILQPGTVFGDMVLLGQQMYGNFAEALEPAVVCVMSRADVQRFLLGDPRIAARITQILGARLTEMERRLCDTVFKNVPQRLASTLTMLAGPGRRVSLTPTAPVVMLTHEQLAALVGTSRETATKALNDLAERGLVRLGRGRITLIDPDGIAAESGD
ncbi:Crp/Fnr family transcriptional regulator [Actinopolymorpha pittospori]|uniref:CRP-like cAMP-binding protein n=1 Tax=Actinopolymorpha pittospori TaxID=648752 RepID=A0A927RMA8_9ACTN|nr:Crp/Fnr family transcriptional regulator [Actinopolymorpha pittospori]MBE1610006.1 CRP-like cAMP-binding protein [Actinopolymorpha pittospori]